MKRKLFYILAFIAGAILVNAQSSRNRLKQTPYSWNQRIVPTGPYLDSTFNAFLAAYGNSVTSNGLYYGSTNNKSWYIKNNSAGSTKGYIKFDSLDQVTILADTNSFNPALTIKSTNNNNSYLQLVGPNISGYRLKNYYTGVEWYMQNQTFAGGIGLDGFGIGLATNPSQCFLQLGARGEFKTESYYANNLIVGLNCDTSAHLGIGAVPQANSLRLGNTHRGATTARGIYVEGTIGSGVTTLFNGIEVAPTMSNTAFTNATFNGVLVSNPSTPHASNVITTANLFNTGTGVNSKITTLYGYRSQITAGANRWGIYADGTATNYFGGAVGIGTVTPIAGYSLDVRGNTYCSGASTVVSTHSAGAGYNSNSVNNLSQINGFTNSLSLFAKLSTGVVNLGVNAGTVVQEVNSGGAKITGTLGINSTTFTAGNSGTIAVLTDAMSSIYLQHGLTSTIVDGATTYFGNLPVSLASSASTGTIVIPYNCRIVGYSYNGYVAGTLASSETGTLAIRVNNTTDNNLTTALTYTTTESSFNSTALSIDLTAGDRINVKIIAPTYATNPTNIYSGLTIFLVRR